MSDKELIKFNAVWEWEICSMRMREIFTVWALYIRKSRLLYENKRNIYSLNSIHQKIKIALFKHPKG